MNSQEMSKFKHQTKEKLSLNRHLPLKLPNQKAHLELQSVLKWLWMKSTSPGVKVKSHATFLPTNSSVWLNTGSTLTISCKMVLTCLKMFAARDGKNSSLG